MRVRNLITQISIFCLFTFHGTAQLTNGLLVNYNFSNNYEDSTPNNFDGTAFGTAFTEDRFGNANAALFFDGTDDFVEFPNDDILRPQFPFSVSLWINSESLHDPSNTAAYGIFDNCFVPDNYHGPWLSFANNANKLLDTSYGDGSGCTSVSCRRTTTATCSLRENIWIHIVAVWESETLTKIYINSELQPSTTSGTGSLNMAYIDAPGVLGKSDSNNVPGTLENHYHGAIDDFYMWNRVLTEEEIAELYDFNAAPIIEFTASTDSVTCNIEEVDLVISASETYSYTLNGSPISLNNLPKLPGGSYTIEATDGTCSATQILEVPFDTIVPVLDITIGNITCKNPAAELSASFHPEILSYNWWSVNGSLIAQGEDATIDEVGNYFLIAVADNGCTQTYEFEVVEDLEEPIFDVSATEITCTDLALVEATKTNPDYVISWNFAGQEVSDAFSFTTDQAGSYVATVTDTVNGCSDALPIEVMGNIVPITGVDFDLIQDCGDTQALFNFNFAIGGVGPYTLSSTAVEMQGDQFFNFGENSITIVDSQGCAYDSVFMVEQIAGITSFSYQIEEDCDKLLSKVENISILGGTADFNIQHSGTEIDGEIFFEEGSQWIAVVDANGCTVVDSLTINPVTQVGFLEFTWEGECDGDALFLTGVFDTVNQNMPWYNDTSGEPFSMQNILPIRFEAGEHFLSVRSFEGQCDYDTTFTVTPLMGISAVEFNLNQGCASGQAELSIDNIIGGTAPYTVEAGTGVQIDDLYLFDSGIHTVNVVDANGCSFAFDIDVSPATAISLMDIPDMMIEWPEEVFLDIVTNRDTNQISSISWSGYSGLSCIDCYNTSLTPDADVLIRYSIEDIFGCTIEQEVLIRVNKSIDIFTPNIFSPNNDGQNDFFNVFVNPEILQRVDALLIYDRWGNLVHDGGNNIDLANYEGWDGTMNNTDVAAGVYVYYYEAVLINNETVSRSGDFTLIR